MSRLEVCSLHKSWGEKPAADGINFSVESGEFVALLGPSGCGKSTTLRMIAGLETPDSGQILLNNNDITRLAPGKRELAMVFQSYALFPHLSVRDNILFGLQVRGVKGAEQTRRLNFAVELVDLGDHLNKKPGQLSGGQCQRVALARAIVSEARLCLMDEPLSNLDAKLRAEMRTELRALQQRLGMSVLYVTHDQTEAMSMADRILLMNNGQIEQGGRPEELYSQPATTFVARFIGAPPMNLLEGTEVIEGIRPEHITLTLTSEPDIQHSGPAKQATVVGCDYMGSDTLIQLRYQDGCDDHALQVRVPGHQRLSTKQAVVISWPDQEVHRFCRQTGKSLTSSHTTQNQEQRETDHVA
ncbi:ABC transporter ATP-binding protein [Parendozoicomonas haliclonae]|uniref:sn-glycerol-3-phosphate import ATP-binding protein UgpC n=1 Tax=Parendozoicomonas haliclonae TaxID=1960125 RepID=A0A1X7AR31_9GAMM|nr:ABC transporter ATP-binding protein [Parendozoicomonas haliclonae]SMA50766.1 sn-glycerol-3-phosphate import ATP-binding protein UgpC [Parendozoicomonas haliclonae]